MNTTAIDRLAATLIYEGYLLYPYRASTKNNIRWTFGGIYPRAWSEASPDRDRWQARASMVLAGQPAGTIDVEIRFLQVIDRQVFARVRNRWEPVANLTFDDQEFHSWQECTERHVETQVGLRDLRERPLLRRFSFFEKPTREDLRSADGRLQGVIVRRQMPVRGTVRIAAASLQNATVISVTVENHSRVPSTEVPGIFSTGVSPDAAGRAHASVRALAALHVIAQANEGDFVSAIDPPPEYREAVDAHRSDGLWPVLVGPQDQRHTMLCSPIILYDYPQIAAESPGDFFDGTEIDEILSLRLLTLSDDEQRHVETFDERGRAILQRTRELANQQMAELHGATRRFATAEQVNHVR